MPWPQPAPPAGGTSPSLPRCVGSRRLIPISSGSCGCSIPAAISWDRRSRSMAEPTIGLVGVGGCVPRYRLSGKALAQVWGGGAGGELEPLLGDGAGAAVVGRDGVIASFAGGFAVSHEFTDVWRNDGDRYVTALPDATFVKSYGLDRHIPEAITGLLERTGRKKEDIAKLVLYGPDARTHAALVRQLKFPDSAMPKESVIGRAGNTGTASCLLGLAAALEEARPLDQNLVVSYGNGAEALLFEATDALASYCASRPVSQQLAAGRPLASCGKLLRFR